MRDELVRGGVGRRALSKLALGGAASAIAGREASGQPAGFESRLRGAGPRRVFVTGSSDGLGLGTARLLIAAGHQVVLHGRNRQRADDAMAAAPGAVAAVTGDLSVSAQVRDLADQVNRLGTFDAVVHNAGVGYQERDRRTEDGLPPVFAINTLAPYVLTALIGRPKRLVYVSSGLHRSARPDAADLTFGKRAWDPAAAYAESKLQDVQIAFAVARRWGGMMSNALEPGWVRTKMGGTSAPLTPEQGAETQAWLAVSDDPAARVSGRYFAELRQEQASAAARDTRMQDALMEACATISGVKMPA